MSKALDQNNLRGGFGLRALAVTMTLSLAAFGCTTNQSFTAGEPTSGARAGGSVTPSMSTTPGSAGPSIPSTMISAAVDPAVDAVAVLEANRGYEGRVLGPAAPGNGGPSQSQQVATGQFISPAVLANPQLTVNSSVSSAPVPAIVSGAVGDGGVVVGGTGFVGDAIVGTTGSVGVPSVGNAATTVGANANFGATGLSNTTATGLTSVTSPATNLATGTNTVVSTGVAAAPGTASTVLATPTLGTSPRLSVDNTAAARGVATTGGALTVNNNGLALNTVTTGTVARAGNVSNVRVVSRNGRVVLTNQQQ